MPHGFAVRELEATRFTATGLEAEVLQNSSDPLHEETRAIAIDSSTENPGWSEVEVKIGGVPFDAVSAEYQRQYAESIGRTVGRYLVPTIELFEPAVVRAKEKRARKAAKRARDEARRLARRS